MPTHAAQPKKTSFIDELLSPKGIGIILIIIIILSVGAYGLSKKHTISTITNIYVKPTPTPTPTKLYPDNGIKGTYNVSANQKSGPVITQVIFDPLNVQKGEPLTLTVMLKNASPVQEVKGTLKMDNSSIDLSFNLVNRTNKDEVWQTTISTLSDSVLYNYIFNVIATAANGQGFGGAAPRSR
jgi:hypothetical protein